MFTEANWPSFYIHESRMITRIDHVTRMFCLVAKSNVILGKNYSRHQVNKKWVAFTTVYIYTL